MDEFQRRRGAPEHIKYAVVPKPILNRFILLRSLRCAVCVVLAFLLILPLTVLPGLVLFVLPAEIALVGRIQDEAELVLWVRANMTIQTGSWDDAELEAEMVRLKAHDRPRALSDYLR